MSSDKVVTVPALDPPTKPTPRPKTSVVLRATTHGNETSTSPPVSLSNTSWYLSHSSRSGWSGARNVVLKCSALNAAEPPRSTQDQRLEFSFTEKSSTKRTTETVGSNWEVVGQGRYGALEDWMIETKYGIEDSSGEVRADWRPIYLMLYFPPEDHRGVGFDLLAHSDRALPQGLVEEVEGVLKESASWTGHLLPVPIEAGIEVPRYEETKPQVWNNPDIYGAEEPSRKCVLQ